VSAYQASIHTATKALQKIEESKNLKLKVLSKRNSTNRSQPKGLNISTPNDVDESKKKPCAIIFIVCM
jgi:hypothetical protein